MRTVWTDAPPASETLTTIQKLRGHRKASTAEYFGPLQPGKRPRLAREVSGHGSELA